MFSVIMSFCDFSNPYATNLKSQQSFLLFTINILDLDFTMKPMIHFEIIFNGLFEKRFEVHYVPYG